MQDLPCTSDLARAAPRRRAALSATVERWRALLRQARGDVAWAPLVARALATAVALLGLGGIGLAASRSRELTELTHAPISAGLAQLVGTDRSAALGTGGTAARAPAIAAVGGSVVAANTAPPLAIAAAPSAHGTETPCPRPAGEEQRTESGEVASESGNAGSARPAPTGSRAKGSGLVILNRADPSDFQRLPGVGAKRAAAIVELRKRLGRFRRPSDLLRVKGIGPKMLERMLPQLALDAPP